MDHSVERDVTKVQVTPAMEAAGFAVLRESGIADDYLEADKLLLAEIYRAMFSRRPGLLDSAEE